MRREQENAGATSALLAGRGDGTDKEGRRRSCHVGWIFFEKALLFFVIRYMPLTSCVCLKRKNRGQWLFCNMWKTRGFFAKKHPLPHSRSLSLSLSLSRAVASAFPSRRARRRAPPPPPHRAASSAWHRPHRRPPPPPTPPRASVSPLASSPSPSPSAAVSASATATAARLRCVLRRHRQRSKKWRWPQSRRRWLRDGEAEAVQMQWNFWLLAARHFSLRSSSSSFIPHVFCLVHRLCREEEHEVLIRQGAQICGS